MVNNPRKADESKGHRPRIVVGVDGSSPSVRALACAGEEAAWRGGTLVVVNAWQHPEGTGYPGYAVGTMEPAAAFEKRSRELIARALADAFGPSGCPVPVISRITESSASAALLSESLGAALLVVGSRGLGGLRSMLGSTSRRCVTHASCPVLVVHPTKAHGHVAHAAGTTAHRGATEPAMRVPLF